MHSFRFMGLFAIIPITMLLTVSFFVLFTIRKLNSKGLKVFGYVIAALLWTCAVLFFSMGIYTMSTGRCPIMYKMHKMMKSPTHHKMMKDYKQHKMMKNYEHGEMMKQ